MNRRTVAVAAAFFAVVVFGACGEEESPPRAKPAKTVSTPPELDAVTSAPPATPSKLPGAATPDDAALTLHDHWVAGDASAAAETATKRAVAELFAHQGNPLEFMGCIREGSKHTCFFYYEGGGLNMIVEGDPAGGYLVTKAFFVAD
jgi:hypothetical protein